MAVCTWCDREMTTHVSCTISALHEQGARRALAPAIRPCGDCGAPSGGLHHLGCDLQRCPCCSGQLISCGCRFDEDGPDPDDEIEGFSESHDGAAR